MTQVESMIYAAVWAQCYLSNTTSEKQMQAMKNIKIITTELKQWEMQQACCAAENAAGAVERFRSIRNDVDARYGGATWALYQEAMRATP